MAGPDGLDEESSVNGSLINSGSSRVVVGSLLSLFDCLCQFSQDLLYLLKGKKCLFTVIRVHDCCLKVPTGFSDT